MGRGLYFVVQVEKVRCMNFAQAEVEVGSMSLGRDLRLRRNESPKDRATEAHRYPQIHPLWSVIRERI